MVLLIAAIGLSGCVGQQAPVDNSQPGGTIDFYSSVQGYPLGFYPVEPSDPKFPLLASQLVGWYAYELSVPPMKVVGYTDSTLGTVAREISVYYVGLSTDDRKEIYRIRIRYDSVTPGIAGSVTPRGQGYPFTININPDKVTGYY